ncbi:MAG: glycoside hydrolase family 2 TIM barrel-domain containing protein [Thermoguttaceae bacterium]|jgi:hypothetical protein|nr:glycoside hydrolase family 2 TIM barrel-domain containing protein [Thermoguttaceae bacterium]
MICRTVSWVVSLLIAGSGGDAGEPVASAPVPQPVSSAVISLDGHQWLLATDPANVGREEKWFEAPRPEAKPTRVPWIIQDAFPGYHGVAWYWREFDAPANPHAGGRYLLRFWAVDYLAEVWLNGAHVGGHEGGESPFVLDVTDAVRAGGKNALAVRVLNPTNEPIDGIVLSETPHRNKVIPYRAGASYNHGGIVDSVELLVVPSIRIDDLFARPDTKTGNIRVQARVRNADQRDAAAQIEFTVAPAASGETLQGIVLDQHLPPGDTLVETELHVTQPRLWDLNEPNLYRVTARVRESGSPSFDEHAVRCGFRDFTFENGYFRLNGRRLFLRCSHTGNHCPVGLQLPPDPDMLRRDLLNVKVMGFNAIRFIAGVATRYQLDLCDEIGLLVYEEPYAAWCLQASPKMAERYDQSLFGMIRRDRNHPSIVIWGLLNETHDGPVFRHAAAALPRLRELDDTRMVMLNSGRWDLHGRGAAEPAELAGLQFRRTDLGADPNVSHNPTGKPIEGLGIHWAPGRLALHPGSAGEFSVVRWTCPAPGEHEVSAEFASIARHATTDVPVLYNGKALHDGGIHIGDHGHRSSFTGKLTMKAGDRLDFVVGFGNGHYGGDTTALAATVRQPDGTLHDAAAQFTLQKNPNGPWSYGWLAAAARPDAATFQAYTVAHVSGAAKPPEQQKFGTLANPGSSEWEDVLDDQHPYQRVPHTAAVIQTLRTFKGDNNPMFISEYGVGSAVDLWRVTRHYERLGKEHVEDAQFYRDKLDLFLADWERWKLADCFANPQEFFAQSIRQMAAERLYGLNALRANPSLVAHSLTGTVDQGMSGEGLFTTFRELKPGTTDAMFEALAPLRLCLFVEPLHVYRSGRVKLEAVLANEDALGPGEYPVRLLVIGPQNRRIFEKTVDVTIAKDAPFAVPILAEDIAIDGPSGRYRFLASFERGGAATGGEEAFYVADPADMPAVTTEVVLAGEDAELTKWLDARGIRFRRFDAAERAEREVILVSKTPPAFEELWRRVEQGAAAVFLTPDVFKKGDEPLGWLPLKNKGSLARLPGWLYHKDEWVKAHPVFDGLPAGGMMDYAFYREIIPDVVFAGQDAPDAAIAGANNASFDYSSGLMLAAYRLGAGRYLLNTLPIREQLSTNPVAERLLRNLLRYAARDSGRPVADLPTDFKFLDSPVPLVYPCLLWEASTPVPWACELVKMASVE